MIVRWFGEPWGVGGRAPICEDDAYKIDPPAGSKCIECGNRITERDRGVVTACSPSFWESWKLAADNTVYSVCSYHLGCWLRNVLPGEMAEHILDRMKGAQEYRAEDTVDGQQFIDEEPEAIEDATPGRGWNR